MNEEIFSQKIWQVAERTQDDLLAQILVNRGVSLEHHERFLLHDWELGTHSPLEFGAMLRAVERVMYALEKGERMVIHGDYDADGVSGSTLLFRACLEIGEKLGYQPNIAVFLPDREVDGYGVALHTVERLANEGVHLLVTVDCGIANGIELGRAHELGMDVVVCDHHQLGQHYPERAIVLHPLAPGEEYPNKTLCGTGVAFKLASALVYEARARGAQFPEGYEKWFLDLVAVATVTDVMPLLGENRALEYFGLRVLQKTRRPGLRAIIEASGTSFDDIDTSAIGFRIGPRLNAAGRMASARAAFLALSAQTPEDAQMYASELERLNRERQEVFRTAYEEARALVEARHMDDTLLVAYAPHWMPGIVGLIAGRLQNDFGKPAFACTRVGEHVVGSGRSMGGLHLVELMNACGDALFVKRGGHPQACGLTLYNEQGVDELRARGNDFARAFYGAEGPRDIVRIDAVVPPSQVTEAVYTRLAQCAPFGAGNREPIFAARGVVVHETVRMGSTGAHIRIKAKDEAGEWVTFVGFGLGDLVPHLRTGECVDIAYESSINVWNGRRSVQYRIVDVKKVGT